PPTKRTRGRPSSEHTRPMFRNVTRPTSDPVAPLKKTPFSGSAPPTCSCASRHGRATGGATGAGGDAGTHGITVTAASASTIRVWQSPVRSRLSNGEPPRARVEPVPAPARRESGRVVSLGRRRVRTRPRRGQTRSALRRLRGVPLVSRDGARVVRGRRDGAADERPLRQREGGSRGAAG